LKKASEKRQQLLQYDSGFLNRGFKSLAGVDEAGRGPLAGPVVASAVIVRDFSFLGAVDDSKKMTAKSREAVYGEIFEKCDVGIGIVDYDVIDEINILQATFRAMGQALARLKVRPDAILVDGNRKPKVMGNFFPIVDGDALSFSIACASIVAKVTRDRIMETHDKTYPQYGFGKHKGYGTAEHVKAIKEHGPCEIHRRTFEPVRSWKPS
jgi:ribonuclease HII